MLPPESRGGHPVPRNMQRCELGMQEGGPKALVPACAGADKSPWSPPHSKVPTSRCPLTLHRRSESPASQLHLALLCGVQGPHSSSHLSLGSSLWPAQCLGPDCLDSGKPETSGGPVPAALPGKDRRHNLVTNQGFCPHPALGGAPRVSENCMLGPWPSKVRKVQLIIPFPSLPLPASSIKGSPYFIKLNYEGDLLGPAKCWELTDMNLLAQGEGTKDKGLGLHWASTVSTDGVMPRSSCPVKGTDSRGGGLSQRASPVGQAADP